MATTVLIGLDGATYTLLDPFMEQGVMPRLKKLVAEGVRATLMSTPHPLTPPAFVSMYTGRSPGHHGIYDFTRIEDKGDTIRYPLSDARDVRCETLWSIANRQNREVTALNFVLTAPPQPVCGFVIPGMVQWKYLKRYTHPQTFYEKLKTFPWFNPKAMCWDLVRERQTLGGDEEVDQLAWAKDHIERELQWFQVMTYIMKKEPTDLVSIVLDGSDKIQHICWDILDPQYAPKNPTPQQKELRDVCIDYYRKVDEFLGECVDLAGPRGRVFLTSDHGFGPNYLTIFVNELLRELGLFFWKVGAENMTVEERFMGLDIDWNKTTAYCPRRSLNGIVIRNVPPDQYDAVRTKIVNALRALKDPTTGKPAIKDVLLRETAFPGPAMKAAPDITVVQVDHNFVSTARSPQVVVHNKMIRGTHYPEGVFVAHGDGIARGVKLGKPLSMYDVTPTMLYSLGLPVPKNLEGQVPVEAFTKDYLAENPVEIGAPAAENVGVETASPEPTGEVFEKQDEKAVMDQLRALGYIE